MLPQKTPAETIEISPEALEVANCYLQLQDIEKVSQALDINPDLVSQYLARREVRNYIDGVFANVGFNNRFRMRAAMDALIKQKFKELEESGMGSTKDIADLLALSHKMTMEELDKQIKYLALQQTQVKNQTNIQINEGISDGTKYGNLIQQLLNHNQNVQQST
jgi:hypothetical protein